MSADLPDLARARRRRRARGGARGPDARRLHRRRRDAAAPALARCAPAARTPQIPASDQDVLNYALVLEYLQAAFYTEAERAKALSGQTAKAAKVVGAVERAHVKAFRDLLGQEGGRQAALRLPGRDRGARSRSSRPRSRSRTSRWPRTRARRGGSSRSAVLTSALGIHTVEARHAAWMRYLNGNTPAAAAFDLPAHAARDQQDRRARRTSSSAKPTDEQPAQAALHGVSRVGGAIALGLAAGIAAGGARDRRADADGPSPRRRRGRARARARRPPGPRSRSRRRAGWPTDPTSPAGRTCARRRRRARGPRLRRARSSRGSRGGRPRAPSTALPVTGRPSGPDGRLWLRVTLPVLPNGTSGWVPRRALGAYEISRDRLVVDLDRRAADAAAPRPRRAARAGRRRAARGGPPRAARSSSATGSSATPARSTDPSRSGRAPARRP